MDLRKYQPRDDDGKYQTYNIVIKVIKGIFSWKKKK